MTIDLYDDVLMPFTIGLLIVVGFMAIGFLIYLLVQETIAATILILIFLFAWVVGFPIWRKYKYG